MNSYNDSDDRMDLYRGIIGQVQTSLRERSGLTTQELADRMRIPHGRLLAIETGFANMELDEALATSDALGISIFELCRRWDQALDEAGLAPRVKVSETEAERVLNEWAAELLLQIGPDPNDLPC